MLGTESDQGKGSLFPIQVQKGYVHMALLKRRKKKKTTTIHLMQLSTSKAEDTLLNRFRKKKQFTLTHALSVTPTRVS